MSEITFEVTNPNNSILLFFCLLLSLFMHACNINRIHGILCFLNAC